MPRETLAGFPTIQVPCAHGAARSFILPRFDRAATLRAHRTYGQLRMSAFPPYMKRATLAGYLDCAESTVDELVDCGVLPEPIRLSPGIVRWNWDDCDAAIKSMRGAAPPAERDPYLAGVANVIAVNSKEKVRDVP